MIKMNSASVHSQENRYSVEVALVDGVYSGAIEIPGGDLCHIAYSINSAGTKLVEATVSSAVRIAAETANWIEVLPGEDINPAVTAIRAKVTGAAGTLEVSCQ